MEHQTQMSRNNKYHQVQLPFLYGDAKIQSNEVNLGKITSSVTEVELKHRALESQSSFAVPLSLYQILHVVPLFIWLIKRKVG